MPTGLFNRRRLKEYMDIRCRDQYFTFAVFYIDLDKFKPVNDTQGHACGDAVLRETAKRIKAVPALTSPLPPSASRQSWRFPPVLPGSKRLSLIHI